MAKTITLRLNDDTYAMFSEWAQSENRSVANLIETMARRRFEEGMFASGEEMAEIYTDENLVRRLTEGSVQATVRLGRFVD
ncbi:MAG: hypothetical protein R8K46_08970 [Mariprofundaceae bacterium]